MIKYLGSKRRLVPVLDAMARAARARTALDLFTGTTRVAQAWKRAGVHVTAVDRTRCAHLLARCFVATDATAVDPVELATVLARLDALPGRDGYVTEVFCRRARYFQPHNGRRIDAIRQAIATDFAGSPLEPVLLTSLVLAADKVDSTTGVQMAYLKSWSARSHRILRLEPPPLLPGPGSARCGDATDLVDVLPPVHLAYLDPPYNQHRYEANYHVWETLVAGDEPAHYGVAAKRVDLREPGSHSPFNRRATFASALTKVVEGVRADVVILSCSDESWITLDEVRDRCATRGHVEVLAFDLPRYVGARIGIHDLHGRKVGTAGRLRNIEYVLVAGDRAVVRRVAAAGRHAAAAVSGAGAVPSVAVSRAGPGRAGRC